MWRKRSLRVNFTCPRILEKKGSFGGQKINGNQKRGLIYPTWISNLEKIYFSYKCLYRKKNTDEHGKCQCFEKKGGPF